jgi:hypothetical protein
MRVRIRFRRPFRPRRRLNPFFVTASPRPLLLLLLVVVVFLGLVAGVDTLQERTALLALPPAAATAATATATAAAKTAAAAAAAAAATAATSTTTTTTALATVTVTTTAIAIAIAAVRAVRAVAFRLRPGHVHAVVAAVV